MFVKLGWKTSTKKQNYFHENLPFYSDRVDFAVAKLIAAMFEERNFLFF